MSTGRVIDEEGHEAEGVLRPNGTVTFTVGRTTRHIYLSDFAELGLVWQPNPKVSDDTPAVFREPVDSPRHFRIIGEGL